MSPDAAIIDCPLASVLAERMRAACTDLTARWLERIVDRVDVEPIRVFPTEDLLDHVPLLILGIADYVEDPARTLFADTPVMAKAMELGALRYAQGFDEYEILKEYEIFGGILFSFLSRTVDTLTEPCTRGELLTCAHRLYHAIALVQQATTVQFLRDMRRRITDREESLRAFHRALTHEFRNRMGAAMGAGQILDLPALGEAERRELAGVIVRNLDSMRTTLDNLLELARVDVDVRQQRHVRLPQAVAEAARQLRDMAVAGAVEVRLGELPDVEVSAAAVELCVTNFLSNAIKYADAKKRARWAEVNGRLIADAGGAPIEVVVTVRDNGRGVPEAQRDQLFRRFFRARHESAELVPGTGLGLSIVRETVEALGGRVWAEFSADGSTFAFALPCRRAADQASV